MDESSERPKPLRPVLLDGTSFDRAATHEEFERLKNKDAAFDRKIMLAARNGSAPTRRDEEGLVDDLADLNRLEDEGKSE